MKTIKKVIFFLFMFSSIVFLLGSCIYFGSRLVHFYLLENGKVTEKDNNFNKILTSIVVSEGDGLYGENGEYYFYGKDVNNYILYSNQLFRILSIDIMGNIKIVSENSLTSIYSGEENIYLKKWIKEYYDVLDKEYIIKTKYCSDTFDDILSCDSEVEDDITLLTMKDYVKAGDINSFLNNNQYYFLSTSTKNGDSWYINDEGYSSILNTKVSLGVKPVITIASDLKVLSGNGSIKDPYIVEDANISELKNAYVGSYVIFSDKLWRINNISDNIKLVLEENMEGRIYSNDYNSFDPSSVNSLANYLNNEFYESLEKDKIMLSKFYNGQYENDYENVRSSFIETYVGLNSIGDIFWNKDSIFTMNPTGSATKSIYISNFNRIGMVNMENSNIYKPVVSISLDTLVETGNGTINSPYILK